MSSASSISSEPQNLIANGELSSADLTPTSDSGGSRLTQALGEVFAGRSEVINENAPGTSSMLSHQVPARREDLEPELRNSDSLSSISDLQVDTNKTIHIEITPPAMSKSDKAVIASCVILSIIIVAYIVFSVLAILYLIHVPGIDRRSLLDLVSYIGCSVIGVTSIVSSIAFFVAGKRKGVTLGYNRCVSESVNACESHVNDRIEAMEHNREALERQRVAITSELKDVADVLSSKQSELAEKEKQLDLVSKDLNRKRSIIRSKAKNLENLQLIANKLEEHQVALASAENRFRMEEQTAREAREKLVSSILESEKNIQDSVEKITELFKAKESGEGSSAEKSGTAAGAHKESKELMDRVSVLENSISSISSSAVSFLETIRVREKFLLEKEVLLSSLTEKSNELSDKTLDLEEEIKKLSKLKLELEELSKAKQESQD